MDTKPSAAYQDGVLRYSRNEQMNHIHASIYTKKQKEDFWNGVHAGQDERSEARQKPKRKKKLGWD